MSLVGPRSVPKVGPHSIPDRGPRSLAKVGPKSRLSVHNSIYSVGIGSKYCNRYLLANNNNNKLSNE